MRVLFFTSPYWGHLSLCLGMANQLCQLGVKSFFGFLFAPSPQIFDIINEYSHSVFLDTTLIKEYTMCASKELKLTLEMKMRENIINYVNPDLIITDGDDFSNIVSHKMNYKVYRVKRTNLHETTNYDIYDFFNHKYFNKSYIPWHSMIDAPCLVPHSRDFIEIKKKDAIYFKPCWANPTIENNHSNDFFDIVIIPTTAENNMSIISNILDILKIYNKKIIVCGMNSIDFPNNMNNIYFCPFSNIEEIISNSKVVLSMGGHGIITRSILRKKPQIIIDIGTSFTKYYAAKIVCAHSGFYLHKSDIYPSLSKIIDEVFSKYDYLKNNATCLAYKFEILPKFSEILHML